MKELTKQDILDKIVETQHKSSVLKGLTGMDRTWTINELIYCLELISFREELNLTICNETDGMSIPCGCPAMPLWVNCITREKRVRITDVEVEEYTKDVGDDEEYVEEICYAYIIVVEEVL